MPFNVSMREQPLTSAPGNKLSQKPGMHGYTVSGIRRLQPSPGQPPVYVVHLPFILSINRPKVEQILKEINWRLPLGEELIESNSNSCLFARAAENKARRLMGFHPDTTRLAREVTVGFICKEEASAAIRKYHPFSKSVRGILQEAHILEPLHQSRVSAKEANYGQFENN